MNKDFILDSFTIFGINNLKLSDLDSYKSLYVINPVEYNKNAFDFVPKGMYLLENTENEIEKIRADPLILDFEINYEIFSEKAMSYKSYNLENIENEEFIDDDDVDSNFGEDYNDTYDSTTSENFCWHHETMRIKEAWNITKKGKKEKGEGIIIAHPDSGYITHLELLPKDERLLKLYQKDLVNSNNSNFEYSKASHGLATASVILGSEKGKIKGIAPKALLLSMRIAKVKIGGATPLLFPGGFRRLRQAVEHAIKSKADIISISLGGIDGNSKATNHILNKAREEGIIVLAAAGNHVIKVTYPATHPKVIAVAASTYLNKPWEYSSRGKKVEITAPGHNIWKADNKENIRRSSGTSYAVANVAGIAALWLGYWGKDTLIRSFGKENLVDGFIKMMRDATLENDELLGGFGKGIIDAEKLLSLDIKDYT